jgi:hypothetical protein
MVPQLVKDLLHLERGQDRLDQHRRLDRAALDSHAVLGEVEDLVPQACLAMTLELR